MIVAQHHDVVLCIRDGTALEVARKACDALGLVGRELPMLHGSDRVTPHTVAVIYDGEPVSASLSIVRQFRTANPLLPLLGFPPMREGVVPFLTLIGETPAAFATGYWGATSDRHRLTSLLERSLKLAPNIAVMQALEEILPAGGAVKLREVAAAIIRLRLGASRVTSDSVATRSGIGPRALRRHWPTNLSSPKIFADRVTMLLALYVRCWTRRGWGTIAAELGTTERALRRLRDSLPSAREAALEQAYRKCADTCSAPASAVARGLELLFEHARDPLHGQVTDPPLASHGTLH
jgi:hypothetical protein